MSLVATVKMVNLGYYGSFSVGMLCGAHFMFGALMLPDNVALPAPPQASVFFLSGFLPPVFPGSWC